MTLAYFFVVRASSIVWRWIFGFFIDWHIFRVMALLLLIFCRFVSGSAFKMVIGALFIETSIVFQ